MTEHLIDTMLDEVGTASVGYKPQPGCVVTVCSSFGCGGAERQTVANLSRLAHDSRVKKVAAVARSTAHPGDDFFLPKLREIPLEPIVYGADWKRASEIAQGSPLGATSRLRDAIDALAGNLREDVVRFSSILVRERPQAVHVRQDMYCCAIACALVGVPNIVIHRGSLAPNRWGLNQMQMDGWVRLLRHAYRGLLKLPSVRMVNITLRCSESDREWLDWPDAARFQIIRNGVDFQSLGTAGGRNMELRRALGIGDEAFVVGGAFRFVPVKRPMLWMAVAGEIAKMLPDAHFVVIGDGAMKDEMRHDASARGFSDRLHMPGVVANVGDWYRVMDLNLLTSEREGLGNVLVEGQHFGVPVLAADVGGVGEAIDPGLTGYLVPPEAEPRAISQAAIRIWNASDWRGAARVAAPKFVHENFSMERAIDRLVACYGLA